MVAHGTTREPTKPVTVFKVPAAIPWATPFPPGATIPEQYRLPAGNYTLKGQISGIAGVAIVANPTTGGYQTIFVEYDNYSDDGKHIINGYECVTTNPDPSNPWMNRLNWLSDLQQTGVVNATKKTGPGGFQLSIDAVTNIFEANGTLTTTIDGVVYRQPANGT
jgi:hypothetical protein